MYRILIVDDHSITRLGISLILKEMFATVYVEEGFDESSAIHHLKRNKFDLMIFDINMPGSDSRHLLAMAKDLQPELKTLVFSMCPEKTYAKYYLKNGANGFLNKEADNTLIKHAINQILNGQVFMSDGLKSYISLAEKISFVNEPAAKLSFREIEVLRRLMQGHSLTDIGATMKLHVSTVSTYKTRIFQKLGVQSLLEIKDLPDIV